MNRTQPGWTPTSEVDRNIVSTLGPLFEEFRKYAALAAEQPASRPYAEAQMKRLLEAMPLEQRKALGRALEPVKREMSRRRRA